MTRTNHEDYQLMVTQARLVTKALNEFSANFHVDLSLAIDTADASLNTIWNNANPKNTIKKATKGYEIAHNTIDNLIEDLLNKHNTNEKKLTKIRSETQIDAEDIAMLQKLKNTAKLEKNKKEKILEIITTEGNRTIKDKNTILKINLKQANPNIYYEIEAIKKRTFDKLRNTVKK